MVYMYGFYLYHNIFGCRYSTLLTLLQLSHHTSLLGLELNACWEGIDLVRVTSVMGSQTGLVHG